jgi:hypothetical protein
MGGYLKVYPGVGSLNVITMLIVEYSGMLAMNWFSTNMIFYFQTQINVQFTDIQKVASNGLSITVFGAIFLNTIVGVIYDVHG